MADVDSVQVALRMRPLVPSERERGCQIAVERAPSGVPQVIVNRTEAFTFNYVFDSQDTQKTVYDACISDMLTKLLCGFNATVLAYGQTGSGKTHTMGTAFDGNLDDDVGLIPRAMYDIFKKMEEAKNEADFLVKCSFMELYQEQLFDLLSTNTREESVVDLREDKNGIFIPGLTEHPVKSAEEITGYLVRGSTGRAVASTAMNQQSSRSHAIFTVTIIATKKNEIGSVTTSKFHLVDLAGSERCTKTQATGDRFKEGVKINQGLLALGNVISALGTGQGATGFVRYRDSKLTRLLQDSLGGNSITLMIACVSPADYNVPETLSTLRYANRARQIKNKPIVNQDPHAAEINRLKDIIQQLRVKLMAGGGDMSGSLSNAVTNAGLAALPADVVSGMPLSREERQRHAEQIKEYQLKIHNLQQQIQIMLHDKTEIEMRAHISEAANEKLKTHNDELKNIVKHLTNEPDGEHFQQRLAELTKVLTDIDAEFENTQIELQAHSQPQNQQSDQRDSNMEIADDDNDQASTLELQELLQPQTEEFTIKQIDFHDQLRRINRELNLKQELHQRVCGNLSKFYSMDDNMEEKFKECEMKIQDLETEKSELLDKLRQMKSSNTSAKLAEERRQRLQNLEHQITEMKRKNVQQAKLLKVREKETQKIQNLSSEIQAMKASKVKLIRTMRQESESFRQWKLIREKELIQLKNKDRKRQNEMARKEVLHNKQRNVLKRKCEEAMAINKRLKDAMERQKIAQTQRQKLNQTKDPKATTSVGAAAATQAKVENAINWIERELEVIISLIDAEYSVEQLMEDRCIIQTRIDELTKQQLEQQENDSNDKVDSDKLANDLANLEEEFEMRNAQIVDLQQKVCTGDVDTQMNTLSESLQNLSESRAVVKQLLKAIASMRREHAQRSNEQKLLVDEQRSAIEAAEQSRQAAMKKIRTNEIEHNEMMAECEKAYNEKIALLLRTSTKLSTADDNSDTPLTAEQMEREKILDEQLSKMEQLQVELDYYKGLVATKKEPKSNTNRDTVKFHDNNEDIDEFDIESDSAEFDDSYKDPLWKETPKYRRTNRNFSVGGGVGGVGKGAKIRKTSTTLFDGDNVPVNIIQTIKEGESFINNDNVNENSTANSRNSNNATINNETGTFVVAGARSLKRKSRGCQCRTNCSAKRCGCNSRGEKCSSNCGCTSICINRDSTVTSNALHELNNNNNNSNSNDNIDDDQQMLEENDQLQTTPPPLNINAQSHHQDQDKENITNQDKTNNLQSIKTDAQQQSLTRTSMMLTFNTPSAKTKFFK